MERKICSKCNLDKPVNEFYKDSNKKDGLTTFCIDCKKESNKCSRLKNIDKRLAKSKEYREQNKDKIKEGIKKWQEKNKEKRKKYESEYRKQNKDKIKERDKKYYEQNKEKILNNYFSKRETELIRMKNWKKNNRPKLAEYQRNYYKKRKQYDPIFKLRNNISALINLSIKNKGLKKNSKTAEILGCSFKEFKEYIETKFQPWMTWDNYGLYNGTENYGWDIDHIMPHSLAKTEEELLKLNHFSNLQPLCSYINRDIKKSNY